jgi:hypothetical protein
VWVELHTMFVLVPRKRPQYQVVTAAQLYRTQVRPHSGLDVWFIL